MGITFLLLTSAIWGGEEIALTQVLGELGEMDRLEQRAGEAIANGDPEGAALSIGKAALMAGLLAQKEEKDNVRNLYETTETLFRGQETGFRALALFERAGGQPPASPGICQFLSQALKMVNTSEHNYAILHANDESLKSRQQQYLARSREWSGVFKGLSNDLGCDGF